MVGARNANEAKTKKFFFWSFGFGRNSEEEVCQNFARYPAHWGHCREGGLIKLGGEKKMETKLCRLLHDGRTREPHRGLRSREHVERRIARCDEGVVDVIQRWVGGGLEGSEHERLSRQGGCCSSPIPVKRGQLLVMQHVRISHLLVMLLLVLVVLMIVMVGHLRELVLMLLLQVLLLLSLGCGAREVIRFAGGGGQAMRIRVRSTHGRLTGIVMPLMLLLVMLLLLQMRLGTARECRGATSIQTRSVSTAMGSNTVDQSGSHGRRWSRNGLRLARDADSQQVLNEWHRVHISANKAIRDQNELAGRA